MGSAEEVRAGGLEIEACMALTEHTWFASSEFNRILFLFVSFFLERWCDMNCGMSFWLSKDQDSFGAIHKAPQGGKHSSEYFRKAVTLHIPQQLPRFQCSNMHIITSDYSTTTWADESSVTTFRPQERPLLKTPWSARLFIRGMSCWKFCDLSELSGVGWCWIEVHGNRTLSGRMFHHTVAPTKEHRSAQKRGGYYQRRAAHKNVPQPVCCIGDATWQVNFLHDQLIEGLESCLKFDTLHSYSMNNVRTVGTQHFGTFVTQETHAFRYHLAGDLWDNTIRLKEPKLVGPDVDCWCHGSVGPARPQAKHHVASQLSNYFILFWDLDFWGCWIPQSWHIDKDSL